MYTLDSLVLALQVPDGSAPLAGSGDVIGLIKDTGPLNQAILAILLIFSIASWAIIIHKTWSFRTAARQTDKFLEVFRKSSKFSEVQAICPTLPASPLVGVFQAGYAEMNAQFRLPGAVAQQPANPEKRLTFLATTASVTPFIGLLGTVIGIMIAFGRIGATGSTNLAIVAPGISEALIATATGLFAAIPATYFYNHFTNRVKVFSSTMDDFALEFLNIVERNFT